MRFFLLTGSFVLVAALLSSAQEAKKGDDFPALQKTYRDEVGKLETRYAEMSKDIPVDYIDSLITLELALAKKGKLDGVLSARRERTRFMSTQEVPEDAVVHSPKELESLQKKFRNESVKFDAEKKKELAKTAEGYIASLEKLEEGLTKKMKIDEATEVQAEIEKIKSTVDLTPSHPFRQFFKHITRDIPDDSESGSGKSSERP